jgi:hypothetical protein
MKQTTSSILLLIIAVAVLVMSFIQVSRKDKVENAKWSVCEIQYEASGIPHEGRANFMQGCFEGK